MTPAANPERYKHHRFPPDIISHAVWLYFRFTLSHRDVEEMLFARGIGVTYEAIRKWCRKFGKLTYMDPSALSRGSREKNTFGTDAVIYPTSE